MEMSVLSYLLRTQKMGLKIFMLLLLCGMQGQRCVVLIFEKPGSIWWNNLKTEVPHLHIAMSILTKGQK